MKYYELPKVEFMGDVHLGRRFIEGVPLERRGERELMVREQFERELSCHDGDIHIQVGDLFDSFDVPNEVVIFAANTYIKAARNLTGCRFFILQGNHDASRNTQKSSSFEIFKAIVREQPNITVVDSPMVFNRIGFMPWNPFFSAQQQAQQLAHLVGGPTELGEYFKLDAVVCHCDTQSYGGDTFNVLPFNKLHQLANLVVTGHEHTKRAFHHSQTKVYVTGSLQPYSHGEDPDHKMYLTMSLQQFEEAPRDSFHFKYVRVLLQPGEEAPTPPDCLGFKTQPAGTKDEESDISVEFESFDTSQLFRDILLELKVDPEFSFKVLEKFQEQLNA